MKTFVHFRSRTITARIQSASKIQTLARPQAARASVGRISSLKPGRSSFSSPSQIRSFSQSTSPDLALKNFAQRKSVQGSMRLNQFVARCGVGSRRAVEQLITQIISDPSHRELNTTKLLHIAHFQFWFKKNLKPQGKIIVNGQKITHPALFVTPQDRVYLNHRPLLLNQTKLWIHYKPKGVIVTHDDPAGRMTLFHHLTEMGMPHCVSVGRLDVSSEGLLLLTNNGELKRYLEDPSNQVKRTYRVQIHGNVQSKKFQRSILLQYLNNSSHYILSTASNLTFKLSFERSNLTFSLGEIIFFHIQLSPEKITSLEKGIWVGDERFAPMKVKVLENAKFMSQRASFNPHRRMPQSDKKKWIEVILTEGRNREIRRAMDALHLDVKRLVRTRYGPYELRGVGIGNVREVPLHGKLLSLFGENWSEQQ